MEILGIDVGGSGIKGAIVDTVTGEFITDRIRIPTPESKKPKGMAKCIWEIVDKFNYSGPVGCGFPAALKKGVVKTAANIHKSWIGVDISELLGSDNNTYFVLNDADAAGIAEIRFGMGREVEQGTVMIITIGTGLGTSLFIDGHLLPNTELGHIEIRGKEAEARASDAQRKIKDLSWKAWAERFEEYLLKIESLFYPDLIILGGGVSKQSEKFLPYINLETRIVPAALRNQAGIIGAALYAQQCIEKLEDNDFNLPDQTDN